VPIAAALDPLTGLPAFPVPVKSQRLADAIKSADSNDLNFKTDQSSAVRKHFVWRYSQ